MAAENIGRWYEYEWYDPKLGGNTKDTVFAGSEKEAKSNLSRQGVYPISVKPKTTLSDLKNIDINLGGNGRVKLKEVALFLRQMATLLKAGERIDLALNTIARQMESPRFQGVIMDMRGSINTGSTVSEAMSKFPEVFDPIVLDAVGAGETNGALESAMERVADDLEERLELQARIKGAATGPIVTLIAVMSVIGVFLVFIVPMMAATYNQLGSELPAPTRALVALSDNIFWVAVALAAVIFAIREWWTRNKADQAMRKRLDPLLLKIPVFGPLMQRIAITRALDTLAISLESGTPILRAIDLSAKSAATYPIRSIFEDSIPNIQKGRLLSAELEEHEDYISPMVFSQIAIGERSGQISTLCKTASDHIKREIDAIVNRLEKLLEPIMTMLVGAIAGTFVIIMYLPYFNLGAAVLGS